jgi:hypothetical protein
MQPTSVIQFSFSYIILGNCPNSIVLETQFIYNTFKSLLLCYSMKGIIYISSHHLVELFYTIIDYFFFFFMYDFVGERFFYTLRFQIHD